LIQEYLLIKRDLIALKALIEKIPLLPTKVSVALAKQESDFLLRSMIGQAVYLDDDASTALLLNPLTEIRADLRQENNVFQWRSTLLDTYRAQIHIGELLAESTNHVVRTMEGVRAEVEQALDDTVASAIELTQRNRWFLGAIMQLVTLWSLFVSYWLFFRRTVVPLGQISRQLDKVGTTAFVENKSDYYIREMAVLAKAVADLNDAQIALVLNEQQLAHRNLELSRANKDLEQFAHVASHDLQEPLRKLQQFSDLLHEDYGSVLGDDGQFYLNAITKSAKRMSLMIRDTLEYASSARSNQTFERVDLQQLLMDLLADLEVLTDESGAEIDIVSLPCVFANPTGVSQLFRNLLVNCMKYRRPELACKIRVSAELDNVTSTFVLQLRDNGIGIEEKYRDKVFEPFERLKTGSVAGTGLGLAICKRVCDAHGWHIAITSMEEPGTCFTISGIPSGNPPAERV
jgi:signal transduction histidine kinase